MRKYVGDKKSIEARSDEQGIWYGTLFDTGRETKFSEATLAEVEELARKHGMHQVPPGRN